MRLCALHSAPYRMTNPQRGREMTSVGAAASGRPMGLPETDPAGTAPEQSRTAKLCASPIEELPCGRDGSEVDRLPADRREREHVELGGVDIPALSETCTSRSRFAASACLLPA